MTDHQNGLVQKAAAKDGTSPPVSQLLDWYAEGESVSVLVDGVRVVVRFVGRKGRRGRIAVVAPAGAVFDR